MLNFKVKDAVQRVAYACQRMETMGERIKRLREARGLTQEQFGKAVGVTKSAVSQWEGDSTKNIKLTTFLRVLDVLHTDANYLISGPGGPSSSGRHRALRVPRASES